ncbi:DMT family transporter [Yoonia sp.]|uniref:DMT family transporter n=1 Tax=Yoonia sp. TaxID=2212373 RepID=UPI0025EA3CD6|nr:DMT family transporter [Yoonia sp.]
MAVILVLGAMALFGLIDNFMRLAAETGGLWQFHLLRSAVALVVLFPMALVLRIRLRPLRPLHVAGRSCLNATAMVIYFGCLGYMPISQAVAGLFTAPIFVVIFSVLFFGETVGLRRTIAVLLGFLGIMLVLRPDAAGIGALTFLPIAAGATYAMGNIATRRWCGGEGTLTLLAAFFTCMLIFGGLGSVILTLYPVPVPAGADGFAVRGWVQPDGIFGLMIVIQGIGSLIGVGLLIRAYQLADATFVAVFENALLVSATIWAMILWGEVPDMIGLTGLLMVGGAGVIIAFRTGAPQTVRAALPEEGAL